MNSMEEWRDIEGYEGLYQVSNYGNGRSLDRYITMNNKWGGTMKVLRKGKKLVKSQYSNGYLFFTLYKNGVREQILVHRAVAKAFIPNPNGLLEVNHKDECKINNVVENLEWCDHSYNSTYNERHEKIGLKLHNRQDLSKKVYLYKDTNLIAEYPSASEAARQLGIPVSRIIQCCNGGYFYKKRGEWINKTVKGYKFSYERL